MTSSPEPTYSVVWPRATLATAVRPVAPRLDTLRGKRIGFLWDYMFRGEELFPELERVLRDQYGAEVVGYDVFGNTHGPEEAQVVGEIPSVIAARGVDAVVSAVGC